MGNTPAPAGRGIARFSLLRLAVKRTVQGLFLLITVPLALFCGFGRIGVLYTLFAHLSALVPGIIGHFWRAAFYKLTLQDCSIDVVIGFGTFFSRREVTLEPNVSIGSYCIISRASIGARTQISSHVEIPAGRTQHVRDTQGRLSSLFPSYSARVCIGADCWIGASAVVMANVGSQTTVGAGSVVVKDIPGGVVAVGVPAKPTRNSQSVDKELDIEG